MFKRLNNLHHAYLIVGDRGEAETSLHDFFLREGVKLTNSPDFFLYKETLFGIDEARSLSLNASRKAFIERKIFLILPEKITHEAQNALLKTFEEPNANTHFFLVVPDENIVLPTLRSRMEVVRIEGSAPGKDADKFLKLTPAER